MADRSGIANRLLAAIPPATPPTSSDASPSSRPAPPSAYDVRDLEAWSDDMERHFAGGGGASSPPPPEVAADDDDDPATGGGSTTAPPTTPRVVANELHSSILTALVFAVDPSPSPVLRGSAYDDDEEAEGATLAIVAGFLADGDRSVAAAGSLGPDRWRPLAALLRATGLFMRWAAGPPPPPSSSSLSSSTPSLIGRLRSRGMLSLYAGLLDADVPDAGPDVPRFASACIFRATYGDDAGTASARGAFVDSADGCARLARALLRRGGDHQPVSRLFSVVRNVHHLMASCPASIPRMERSIESLAGAAGDDGGRGGLPGALVATMARACRCGPPLPEADPGDRRPDLVLEVLRALYAFCANGRSAPSGVATAQIGIMLCELLRYPSADGRLYEIKLAVVSLLLNAPREYGGYLLNNGGVEPLIEIMERQTLLVVVERTGSSADDAAAVVPILLVMMRLVQSDESVSKVVKDAVFPPDSEIAFGRKAEAEIGKGRSEGKVDAKNMAPLDAPSGTLRWRLIRLMTWRESNVKRSACELLWALCGGNSTQFVLRTGFGNAIYFLGIKGCVKLPASVGM
jgi:hypothetical protein